MIYMIHIIHRLHPRYNVINNIIHQMLMRYKVNYYIINNIIQKMYTVNTKTFQNLWCVYVIYFFPFLKTAKVTWWLNSILFTIYLVNILRNEFHVLHTFHNYFIFTNSIGIGARTNERWCCTFIRCYWSLFCNFYRKRMLEII